MTELASQGEGSRKRARRAEFIPAWGDASWGAKTDDVEDGHLDVAEARGKFTRQNFVNSSIVSLMNNHNIAIVAAATTEATTATSTYGLSTKSRTATFPEDELQWVPRKRHNTRWPIESRVEANVKATDAPTAAAEDTPHAADEKQMRRRSTRRLSRRVSFAPIDDTVQSPVASRSPIRSTPRRSSMIKVSGSPRKIFTILATPTNVILAAPLETSPVKSPVKQLRLSPVAEAETDLSTAALEALPVLFDQPVPDVQVEPQHEARRRVSLQNARRSERRRSGIKLPAVFEPVERPQNRRHSFLGTDIKQTQSKGRRHTLGAYSDYSGEVGVGVASPPTDASSRPPVEASQAEVVVDAGTNLDIFGTSPELPSLKSSSSQAGGEQDLDNPQIKIGNGHGLFSDTSTASGYPTSSPIANALGLLYDQATKDATSNQAATAPPGTNDGAQHLEIDRPVSPIEVSSPQTLETCGDFQQDDMFLPHDPEGLSTIFEESFSSDSAKLPQSGGVVDKQSELSDCEDMVYDSPPPALQAPHLQQTLSPPSTSEDETHAPHSTDANSMSSSDTSMTAINPSPATKLTPAVENECDHPKDEMPWQSLSSPTPSDESVEGSSDDFCGAISVDPESNAVCAKSVLEPASEANAEVAGNGVTTTAGDLVSSARPEDLFPQPENLELNSVASTPPENVLAKHNAADEEAELVPETPPGPNTGFTPINDRRVSPTESDSNDFNIAVDPDDLDEAENDGIVTAMDYEPTVPIEDLTATLADTIALQDDSETEMLRKFVTRVKADKSAKEAAAAALAKRNLARKRRSGSTSSTTSATGSPIGKSGSPTKRQPLGEKDLNSPSPTKKRKTPMGSDDFFKGKTTLFSEESTPPLKTKRRRKRLAAELETTLDQSMSLVDTDQTAAAADAAGSGLRRSTRSRNTRVALRPPAPSANSIALSMIPVRLPGSSGGMMSEMDRDMPAIVIPNTRNEEKDLAAVTRLNTRKNKGNSVPPKMVLASQSEDPSWRMKELKGVFDAREGREASASSGSDSDSKSGRKCRPAKGVRWAEELARFQVEGAAARPPASRTTATKNAAVEKATAPVDDVQGETSPPPFPTPVAADELPEPEQQQQPPAAKKSLPKRTRASRLQMPTPIRKSTSAAPQAEKPAVQLPAKRSAAAAAAAASSSASTSSTGPRMATRRTKIASLGMSANGTPAPKRRTKTVS